MPVSCQPARTQPGAAYTSDCMPAATTHTVHTLSVEHVPTQSAFTGPTATQPELTLAQHALLPPRPVMNECTPTTPRPAMSVHTMHECAHAMPLYTMSECALTMSRPVMLMNEYASAVPGPAMSECAPTMPRPVMSVNECTLTMPRPMMHVHTMNEYTPTVPGPAMPVHAMNDCTHTMPQPTWPVQAMNEHALATPRPTVPGLAECTHTVSTPGLARPTTSDTTVPMHVMSQSTVPGHTSPEVKPQPCTSSLVVHPSTPPAPGVTQPQVVLIKQFQQPKPYSGATSWKGYREYFERLAAVNGWATPEQKVEQLALALEGPATEVLRDLDTSRPQAYNIIWEALARRFGSLDGAREAMRRFDSRHQEDNKTIPDFEQALRTLHREAWPTTTPE